MTLCARLTEYISACFTGMWIQSPRARRCPGARSPRCAATRTGGWPSGTSNAGLQIPGQGNGQAPTPAATIRWPPSAPSTPWPSADSSAILVLVNFHRFLQAPRSSRPWPSRSARGKQNRTFVVVLSPVVQIPTELEKLMVVVEHDLPGREQLEEIARGIATEDGELPEGDASGHRARRGRRADPLRGRGGVQPQLVRHRRIRPDAVWELKSQMLKKSGLLAAAPRRRAVRRPRRPGGA